MGIIIIIAIIIVIVMVSRNKSKETFAENNSAGIDNLVGQFMTYCDLLRTHHNDLGTEIIFLGRSVFEQGGKILTSNFMAVYLLYDNQDKLAVAQKLGMQIIKVNDSPDTFICQFVVRKALSPDDQEALVKKLMKEIGTKYNNDCFSREKQGTLLESAYAGDVTCHIDMKDFFELMSNTK